ncbi:MAG TPA: ATP-binding protein [Pirellulaceae bacterium]|jgi:PAS domain S-box-containing protein|nr:ATP-binding protein [Pirellulaceae bacterium]
MLRSLFDTTGFPARWSCGPTWQAEPFWGWLHIVSDLGTFGAYTAIPIVLLCFILKRRQDIPFPRLFALFGAFIFACGGTHLVESLIFWYPIYRFSGVLKFGTALVSWATVISLIQIAPKALKLRGPADLEEEVRRRTQQYEELAESFRQEAFLRERFARSLVENEERLRMVLHVAEIGCWDWDLATGAVRLDLNQVHLSGIGAETGTVQAEEFLARVHPDDQDAVRRAIDDSTRDNVPYACEFRFVRPDGRIVWLSGRGGIVVDDSGRRRMAGVNIDITARKKTELELMEARRQAEGANLAKTQFVANMSHEIRTPLTAILGCADLLVRDSADDDSREMAEMIRNQGQLLLGILNDVLDVSKMEAGKLDIKKIDVSLAPLLADVRSLMEPGASEKGLSFQARFISPVPPTILTDPLRMRQILLNLVSNAVKFTQRGEVRMECGYNPDVANSGGSLFVRIIDTGPGIPHDRIESIFEPFTQVEGKTETNVSGTGLGLTICRRLAQMLDGEIDVTTEPGIGSEFEMRLRLASPVEPELLSLDAVEADAQPAADAAGEASLADARVLIAEDTRSIQVLLRRMLQDRVAKIEVVGDGEAALAEYDRAARSGEPYDLVLMDMQMPLVDGYEATRRLREAGVETPVIALTASAMSGDRENCQRAGCNSYLTKPVDRRELLAELERWNRAVRPAKS